MLVPGEKITSSISSRGLLSNKMISTSRILQNSRCTGCAGLILEKVELKFHSHWSWSSELPLKVNSLSFDSYQKKSALLYLKIYNQKERPGLAAVESLLSTTSSAKSVTVNLSLLYLIHGPIAVCSPHMMFTGEWISVTDSSRVRTGSCSLLSLQCHAWCTVCLKIFHRKKAGVASKPHQRKYRYQILGHVLSLCQFWNLGELCSASDTIFYSIGKLEFVQSWQSWRAVGRENVWQNLETMSNEEQMKEPGMINLAKRRRRKDVVTLLRYLESCQVEKVGRCVPCYPRRQMKVSDYEVQRGRFF